MPGCLWSLKNFTGLIPGWKDPLTSPHYKTGPCSRMLRWQGSSAQASITNFILSRHRAWNIMVFMFSLVLCTLYNILHSFLSVGLSYFKTFLVSQAFICFFKTGFYLDRLISNSVTPRTLNSWSCWLPLPITEIIEEACFIWFWESNPGLWTP